MLSILLGIGFFLLLVGTITDFWYREVPDWLSFGSIFAGLGLRLIWSVQAQVWSHFIQGLIGFGILFIFGMLMFRLGQWGGGDSKVLMALGAILGLSFEFDNLLVAFFINAAFAGAAYGLLWSIVLALRNWKKFSRHLRRLLALKEFKKAQRKSLFVAFGLIVVSFIVQDPAIKIGLGVTALMVVVLAYMYAFIKAVEFACMYKKVTPDELTVGDWIAKNMVVKGKYICGPKDLGIEKKQINLLKKLKIKKILIRTGIPFVPSFFIAYILMLLIGNPLIYLL